MTHRTFISIILAAALAVTGMTTTPARAGNDDVAKWIAGALALGLIGAAIADDRRKDRVVTREQHHDHPGHFKHQHKHKRHDHGAHRQYRYQKHALPAQCRRAVATRRGEVRGFGRRCLLNNYRHFNALPHNCAVQARDFGGRKRVIYQGRCLRQYGYQVADRRK